MPVRCIYSFMFDKKTCEPIWHTNVATNYNDTRYFNTVTLFFFFFLDGETQITWQAGTVSLLKFILIDFCWEVETEPRVKAFSTNLPRAPCPRADLSPVEQRCCWVEGGEVCQN